MTTPLQPNQGNPETPHTPEAGSTAGGTDGGATDSRGLALPGQVEVPAAGSAADSSGAPESASTPASTPAVGSLGGDDGELQWRRVHPLTPLSRMWVLITGLIVFFFKDLVNVLDGRTIHEIGEVAGSLQRAPQSPEIMRGLLIGLGATLGVIALLAIYMYVAWRFTRYAISDESVIFQKGILFKEERHLRLDRIQAVDVIAPLLGRLFGLAKLHVDAAGSSDSQVDIYYLKAQKCTDLRAEILARAAGVKVEATQTAASREASAGRESGPIKRGSGIVGDLTTEASPVAAPELTLYRVPSGDLVRSMLLNLGVWVVAGLIIGLCVAIVGTVIYLINVTHDTQAWGAVPGLLMAIGSIFVALVSWMWNTFNGGWNFLAAASPDGIRLRHGLTEHRSQTVPPGRIHAVGFSQDLLWRGRDWWKVETTQAGYSGEGEDGQKSKTLLPVGPRAVARQALWLVEKHPGRVLDLEGNALEVDFEQVLSAALTGSGASPGVYPAGRGARYFDWLTWRRRAFIITENLLIIRGGRFTRRVSFIPHARIQSVALEQGPLDRRLGLANVVVHLVPGSVWNVVKHLEEPVARALWQAQMRRAGQARAAEGPEAWMQRVRQVAEN